MLWMHRTNVLIVRTSVTHSFLSLQEKLLNKSLQRGGDPYFDNLCRTLHGISELCLPSVINALIGWHQRMELKINESMNPTLVIVTSLISFT